MHSRNITKVMVAVFAGALVGALVALQFNTHFWWVGLLAGGLVGYLAYDPVEVIRSIPTAWRTARREVWRCSGHALAIYFRFLIRERRKVWHGNLLMIWLCIWFLMVAACIMLFTPEEQHKMSLQVILLFMVAITAVFGQAFGSLLTIPDGDDNDTFYWMLKHFNPFRVIFYSLPRGLFFGTILLIKFSFKFTVTLFKLIHSDLRLLCGIDAAIGAAIGYLTINPLLGATIGAIWGLLNYWLISVKWLKLASKQTA